jgi:hypothetical protein
MNATISAAGHASNPMATNLMTRIGATSLADGLDVNAVAIFALPQGGDIVLACSARWSKVVLHTKAWLGW